MRPLCSGCVAATIEGRSLEKGLSALDPKGMKMLIVVQGPWLQKDSGFQTLVFAVPF